MANADCIPDEVLHSLVAGTLADEEAAPWEAHLVECSACLQRTQVFNNGDTVVAALKASQAHARWGEESSAVDRLIERLADREQLSVAAAPTAASVYAETPTFVDATMPTAPTSEAGIGPDTRVGPYRIVKKLGEGGMGAVYLATHTKLQKNIAMKILSQKLTSQAGAIARFEREMRAVGKLNHPHIVQAFDAGEVDGHHYLAMEYIEGSDLHVLVKQRGPMSIVNACKAVRQTAMALSAAHAAGLVHRDLKPSNLLIGKNGQVKLLDLGLALLADESAEVTELTTAGQTFGTPDYMAPEQWEDSHTADARTDLYALGCTLYFLLVGHPPYGTDKYRNAVAKMKGHVTDPIPDLNAARPDAPAEVAAIYQKLLAKSPADRYQTATQLVDALAPFALTKTAPAASSAPVTEAVPTAPFIPASVTRTGSADKGGRSWTPRKIAAAAGGAAAMLLLGAIVITITNKDGSKTTVEVPGDARQIDVAQDGKSLMKVTPPAGNASTTATGWHGWPADAPKPAIAPFDAAQAKKHQEEWATYLKVPVEYTNTIGMKFRLIPPGEFFMGSTPEEMLRLTATTPQSQYSELSIRSGGPRHRVVLTKPFFLGQHEVTQRQYERLTGSNPSHFSAAGPAAAAVAGLDTSQHPVDTVGWKDSVAFCEKLSLSEGFTPYRLQDDRVPAPLEGPGYRLPTEAEWEYACRAGTTTFFWTGDDETSLKEIGWSESNSEARTHAVGTTKPNPFGLFDMQGNLWEWVLDDWTGSPYAAEGAQPAVNPYYQTPTPSTRGVRGGGWQFSSGYFHSGYRGGDSPDTQDSHDGLRVVISVDSVKQALNAKTKVGWHGWPADAPKPAIAPFDAAQAKKYQEEWAEYLKVPVEYTNSIGMKFRLIPPGEFLMGSTPEETEPLKRLNSSSSRWLEAESPQHRVVLTQPLFVAMTETTVGEFRKFVVAESYPTLAERSGGGEDWSLVEKKYVQETSLVWTSAQHAISDRFPVMFLTAEDARAYCDWLGRQQQLAPAYGAESLASINAIGYRLLTEAEWEFACRAGTTGLAFCDWQNDDVLRGSVLFKRDGDDTRYPVATKSPNPFGLFDMLGGITELCQDRFQYDAYTEGVKVNPMGPTGSVFGSAIRGGSFDSIKERCRSAARSYLPISSARKNGFRVALSVDAVRQMLKVVGPAIPRSEAITASTLPSDPIDFAAERKAAESVLENK